MNDAISKELFEKYHKKYNEEVSLLEQDISKSNFESSNLEKAVEKCLAIAQTINSAWVSANFEEKQQLQKLVFPDGIVYSKEKGVVRTPGVNSIFAEIEPLARVMSENKWRLIKESPKV